MFPQSFSNGHHGPSNVTTQKTSDVRPPGIMSGDSKTEPSLYEDFVTSLSTPQTQVAFTSNYEGPKNKRKRQLNSIARYISSSDSSLITGHALVPLMSENLMLEKQDEKKDRLSSILTELSGMFPEENMPSMIEQDDPSNLCPTPIASIGVQVVPTLSLSESLLPLLQEKSSISSLLRPLTDDDTSGEDFIDRFRPYQANQWNERYQELLDYKKKYGHCNVPYLWTGNNPLSQWVKRQRHQYKLKNENRHSNLSDERQKILDEVGFVWDSRAAAWEERYEELKLFDKEHGHCKVTKKFVKYSQLAVWLKRQRHHCRSFLAGDRNNGMSSDRVSRLIDLGLSLNCKRG